MQSYRDGFSLEVRLPNGINNMHTKGTPMPLHKTAVTIPEDLLAKVDEAAEQRGESRSRYITRVLRAAVGARRDAEITKRLNSLFSNDESRDEQQRTTADLQASGVNWGDERW
jgi:hypothetical protein